jgi:hypothetical protein
MPKKKAKIAETAKAKPAKKATSKPKRKATNSTGKKTKATATKKTKTAKTTSKARAKETKSTQKAKRKTKPATANGATGKIVAKRSSGKSQSAEEREQAISTLAHHKWEEAGRPVCDGAEFWLAAEKEIMKRAKS